MVILGYYQEANLKSASCFCLPNEILFMIFLGRHADAFLEIELENKIGRMLVELRVRHTYRHSSIPKDCIYRELRVLYGK